MLNHHQQQQKQQLHQLGEASNQEWGRESKNHQNGNETPQTLMSTLVDCHFLHF